MNYSEYLIESIVSDYVEILVAKLLCLCVFLEIKHEIQTSMPK